MRLQAANFLKSSASRHRPAVFEEAPTTSNTMDVETAEHLSLFGSIKQGNDTCQLQSVCVPIPLDNGDPQVVIYPKCYEVVEMVYVGNGTFYAQSDAEHLHGRNTPRARATIVPECPAGFVIGSDCTCQCVPTRVIVTTVKVIENGTRTSAGAYVSRRPVPTTRCSTTIDATVFTNGDAMR
ncbi:hypothetical protein OSTOST_06781 [Ostertagia ostertagi]